MKIKSLKFTTLLILTSFIVNSAPRPDKEDCVESSCDAMEAMSCCSMGDMEMADCTCPEMNTEDNSEPDDLPAVPTTSKTKVLISFETIILELSDSKDFSKRTLNNFNSTYLSTLKNKIYKETNTFLI